MSRDCPEGGDRPVREAPPVKRAYDGPPRRQNHYASRAVCFFIIIIGLLSIHHNLLLKKVTLYVFCFNFKFGLT